MTHPNFARNTYFLYNDPLDEDQVTEHFWTLEENDPEEIDKFIDMEEVNEPNDESLD